MKDEHTHKDDYNRLFRQIELPNAPRHLEDRIMNSIQFSNSKTINKLQVTFSVNLWLFAACVFILSIISLFQYFLEWEFSFLFQAKQIVLISMAVFLAMWLGELLDQLLQRNQHRTILHS